MATSKTSNPYNRQTWEEADFPILCQTCLGDNPYIRMTKEPHGKECKVCTRPFTVFRWCPGAKMRFKKTEVCQTCAKLKNVCQTCLLDLEYGLPIQVRDAALAIKDTLPKTDVNREYYAENVDRQMANIEENFVGKSPSTSDLLMKLARTTPYYKRNRPHICSFWVKGECKRGEECPYRHEKPTDPEDPLADQNIKDRYYGINDPVADKLMRRAAAMPQLDAPEDKSISTLYVGNLGETVAEKELRDHFYQYGEIRSVSVIPRQQCAFVQFTSRAAAELAVERTFNKLILQGRRLNIKWGKSQAKPQTQGYPNQDEGRKLEPVPGLPLVLTAPSEELTKNYFNLNSAPPIMPLSGFPALGMPIRPPMLPPFMSPLPPGIGPLHPPPPGIGSVPFPPNRVPPPSRLDMGPAPPRPTIHYPSQDPQRLGATAATADEKK